MVVVLLINKELFSLMSIMEGFIMMKLKYYFIMLMMCRMELLYLGIKSSFDKSVFFFLQVI